MFIIILLKLPIITALYYIINSFSHIISGLDPLSIIIVILLQAPIIFGGGLCFYFLAKRKNICVHWYEWMGLSFIANTINQWLPYRPGFLLRYGYMQRCYNMKLKDFIEVSLIYFLLQIFCAAIFMVFGYQNSKSIIALPDINFAAATLFLAIIFALLVYKRNKIKEFINRVTALSLKPSWHSINLYYAFFSVILINFFTTICIFILFNALHAPISIYDSILLSGILSASLLVQVTPGNIGLIEALFASLGSYLYQDASIGLSVALVFRATQIFTSITASAIFFHLLAGNIRSPNKVKVGLI